MSNDIRIAIGLADHPKVIKLTRKLGEGAFRCLVRLWCYAAQNRCSGVLSGMDDADIAIASGWAGDEKKWVETLAAVGLLDLDEHGLTLHDWAKNNPYVFHSDKRSEKARNAAEARWAKRNHASSNAPSIDEQSHTHSLSNAPSPSPSPSPSPAPLASSSPKPRGTRWPSGQPVPEEWVSKMFGAIEARGLPKIDVSIEALKFTNHWTGKTGRDATKLDWERTFINWCLNACGHAPQRRQ